ncbi:ATP phosphoribosyltransferase [Microcystis aeruginosa NIES-44]|uniref:ATP phosphoribosyltransferase n=1 Tax=Microcystis aeruginosa NIES-44 TaxID=449439 RepID=A0A0A1VZN7_MICAE|nr:ATP phosphoribosyltransferase [Microcystis aeruginosa NIES-44]
MHPYSGDYFIYSPHTLHPTPYTLHPTPYTPHPTPLSPIHNS